MSDRDCPHGHKLGKCDTCELIEAEQRIAELKTENDRLRLMLDTAKIVEREHMKDAEIAALRERIALLEKVAEKAEKHWLERNADLSRRFTFAEVELGDALRAAGYLEG